jgi:hypothetical protein
MFGFQILLNISSQLLVNKFIFYVNLKQYRNSFNLLIISYQYILNPTCFNRRSIYSFPRFYFHSFPYLAKKLEIRYLLLLLRKCRSSFFIHFVEIFDTKKGQKNESERKSMCKVASKR